MYWNVLKSIWNQFEIHFLPAHVPEAKKKHTKTVSDQTNSYCMILHANPRKDAKTSTLQKPSENQYQLQKSTQLPWHNVSPVAGFQGNSLRTSATQDTWSTASAWGADAAPGSVPFALSEELWWNPLPEAFQPHLQISFHPHSALQTGYPLNICQWCQYHSIVLNLHKIYVSQARQTKDQTRGQLLHQKLVPMVPKSIQKPKNIRKPFPIKQTATALYCMLKPWDPGEDVWSTSNIDPTKALWKPISTTKVHSTSLTQCFTRGRIPGKFTPDFCHPRHLIHSPCLRCRCSTRCVCTCSRFWFLCLKWRALVEPRS